MRDACVFHQPANPVPAKPLEERDVRRLDEGLHELSALGAGPAHGEPHERCAQTMVSVPRQNREPVALPPAWFPGQRIEANSAAHDPVGGPDNVDRRRIVVVGIAVLAGEQTLLRDKHLMPDHEMGGDLARRGGAAAAQPDPFRPGAAGGRANR